MNHLIFSGTTIECAEQLGKSIARNIRARMRVFGITQELVQKHQLILRKIDQQVQIHTPHIVNELQAMAKGAGVSYWQLLLLNTPEIINLQGCTSIAHVDKNSVWIAHNEDGDVEDKKQWGTLVTWHIPNITLHAFVYPGELLGAAFGWNSQGLYFVVDNLPLIHAPQFGIPRTFVVRMFLECSTLNQVRNILNKNIAASGYHYFVGKGKKILSIEHTRNAISEIIVKGTMVHSNHYIHPPFTLTSKKTKGSVYRLDRAIALMQKGKGPLEILWDKAQRPYAIFARTNDVNRTLATVCFDPVANVVYLYTRDSHGSEKQFLLQYSISSSRNGMQYSRKYFPM